MTVALGLACSDGALVASDSMGIHGRLASPIIKVHAFEELPAVWTFAGSTFVAQEIEQRLLELEEEWTSASKSAWDGLTANTIKREIEERLRPAMAAAYGSIVTPPGGKSVDHSTDFMFACWQQQSSGFLIRIYPDLAVHTNTEPLAAMGYGHEYATVARGLMSHHLQRTPTLHQGKLLAHRTISTVCEVSSGGVGLPVQIAVVDSRGARVLDTDDVDAVSVAVDRWKQLERETLDFGSNGGDKGGIEEDLPDFK